jgi:hypothetical protein
VSQALSFWQQLIKQLPEIKTGTFKQHNLNRFSEPGIILGLLTFIVAMLIWNWKLLLAIMVGVVVMLVAYSIPKWNWKINWIQIYQSLKTANNRLLIAGISGIFATLITYIGTAIWLDSPSIWIAVGATLQGFGTLITLALLLWQILTFQTNKEEDYLQQLLNNLTEKDSLKRLLAVRQLRKFINSQNLDISVQQDVTNCLKLLLTKEEETVIREAALSVISKQLSVNS